jgi:hypothetical protein
MQLHEYPQAIAQSNRAVLTAERVARNAKIKLDEMIAQIDTAIAFDSDLKNDAQRKSRRAELLLDPTYRDVASIYQAEAERLEDLKVDHQLILNRFSVAKLEAREAIAEMEMRVAA